MLGVCGAVDVLVGVCVPVGEDVVVGVCVAVPVRVAVGEAEKTPLTVEVVAIAVVSDGTAEKGAALYTAPTTIKFMTLVATKTVPKAQLGVSRKQIFFSLRIRHHSLIIFLWPLVFVAKFEDAFLGLINFLFCARTPANRDAASKRTPQEDQDEDRDV